MGGVMIAPAVSELLSGCQAGPDARYTPVFFTPPEMACIRAAADRLLPRTATPGAIDAGVPQFIDLMAKEALSKRDQETFRTAIAVLEGRAVKGYGKSFVSCLPEQQDEILRVMESAAAGERRANLMARPFFWLFKELTLLGYFTSEAVATQVLRYEPVPGRYESCAPLSKYPAAWAS